MAEEVWESLEPSILNSFSPGEKETAYAKIYLATGNSAKLERAKKLFSYIDESIDIEVFPDLKEVEETGTTPMECAMQKIEVYK